jgi:hypoxia up-regulated 1
MIQAAVKAVVGRYVFFSPSTTTSIYSSLQPSDKISQNVNADEAAVLGAALHGASLSPSFKTKDIKITDVTLHDIQVSYEAASTKEGAVKPRTITTTIFPAGSKTGSKKTLTFKHQKDFVPWFHYRQAPAP